MYRIYHDFNKVCAGPADERIRSAPLVCAGTKRDLEDLGITLKEGMEVTLYMPDAQVAADGLPDDLEVRGVVRYDDRAKCFVADYVLADLMYRSEAESRSK
jgi:hypothetical protein